jgi:hypothetical protein
MAAASFAPAEIGRDRNATGGEQLIAFIGNGVAIGLGLESQWLGLQLTLEARADHIQVENEFGTRFPNHGGQPAIYSATLLVYPLAPLGRAIRHGSVRPFATASVGGLLVSVDLDNTEDQTTYHLWHYGLGGGVRLFVLDHDDGFIELAFRSVRVRGHEPLQMFTMRSVAVGVGMRR